MGIETGTAMLIGSGVSAASGIYGASQASKAGKIGAPAPRNYLGEMKGALGAQKAIYPELLGAERAFVPQFQDLQKQTLMGQIGTIESLYGAATPMAQRLGQQTLSAMSPLMGGVGQASMNAYNAAMGPQATGLLSTMQRQAANELAMGRGLSPEEQMYAQQAARAASQARGMGYGNQAVATEVLNDYNLANAREIQRRQYAAGVYGTSQQAAGQAYQMYGAPLMNLIGQTSAGSIVGQGFQSQAGLGPSIFNPESQYNADVTGANQQNQMSAALARSQARAGMGAGLMSMAGNIAGSMLSNEALFAGKTPKVGNVNTNQNINNMLNTIQRGY